MEDRFHQGRRGDEDDDQGDACLQRRPEERRLRVARSKPQRLEFAHTRANIWRYEYQNRNAQELVRRCTALYDKFVGFIVDLEEIGGHLKAAQSSYDDAYGKLASGKGNLIRQVERIRELGLKPSKPLPGHLTELAVESESAAQQ